MTRLVLAFCLCLAACADPTLDAGFAIGIGDDGGGEVSLSF